MCCDLYCSVFHSDLQDCDLALLISFSDSINQNGDLVNKSNVVDFSTAFISGYCAQVWVWVNQDDI